MKKYKGKILVVDDSQIYLDSIERALKKKKNLTSCFTDGNSAITAVTEGLKYDMALVDFQLGSGVWGDEIAKELKKLHPNIPVFSFTGSDFAFENTDGFINKSDIDNIEKAFRKYVLAKRR